MSEFKQFDDLENHLVKMTAVLNQFDKFQQSHQSCVFLIEKLTEDLQNLRESNDSLKQQLLASPSYSEEENKVHTFYANLKEKYNQLERAYYKIEKKNLFIEQNHMLNVIQLEENFEHEKERINRENLKKIELVEAKLAETKAEMLKMEKQLQNELQILQAASAVQIDDTESRLQSQLREANHKNNELCHSANIMRNEVLRLHALLAKKENSEKEKDKTIETLQQKLILAEEELIRENNKNNRADLEKNYSDVQQFTSTSFQERLYGQDIYESEIVQSDITGNSSKNNKIVIPLVKSPIVPKQSKKRRLFDPKCLDYLKDYEQPR